MKDAIQAPLMRVRCKHVFTARDGWRLDETTAEVEEFADADLEDVRLVLEALMREAYAAGLREVRERNADEGRPS